MRTHLAREAVGRLRFCYIQTRSSAFGIECSWTSKHLYVDVILVDIPEVGNSYNCLISPVINMSSLEHLNYNLKQEIHMIGLFVSRRDSLIHLLNTSSTWVTKMLYRNPIAFGSGLMELRKYSQWYSQVLAIGGW